METDANPTGTNNTSYNPSLYPGNLISSRPTNNEYYEVLNLSKGLMIIFNHHEFHHSKDISPRRGTEHDLEKLKNTFNSLGYTVRDYTDLKRNEILAILSNGKKFK